jgi:HJR/Mrr/RecB family endonuclease
MTKSTTTLVPKFPAERMAEFVAEASAQAQSATGITDDQIGQAKRLQRTVPWITGIVVAVGAYDLWKLHGDPVLLVLLLPFPGAVPFLLWAFLSDVFCKLLPRLRVVGWTVYQRQYNALIEDRVEGYRRDILASVDWWKGLDGHAFEHELARLLRQHGFEVEVTKASGDGGVDIVGKGASGPIAIQCKRYAKPVGPAVIRELYGAVVSGGYSLGILAVTGGVTNGVREFAEGKPLRILGLEELIKLQTQLNERAATDGGD